MQTYMWDLHYNYAYNMQAYVPMMPKSMWDLHHEIYCMHILEFP